MKVRLFAALRDLAGASELDEDASTVGALIDRLSERFGADFARIATAGSVIVGDERADRAHALSPSDEVAILPPVSGGNR
jgi:MoaD family protein